MDDAELILRVSPTPSKLHLAEPDPLQQRRESGKVAQRNFRNRQAAKALELKQQHENLRSIVERIVLAQRDNDQTSLNHAIVEAGKAVGVEVGACSQSTIPDCPKDTHTSLDPRSSSGIHTSPSVLLDTARPGESVRRSHSGRLSPRLDYGLWLDPDRFLKIFEPPTDIRPYIGPGMYTVAGHIAWACLDYGHACLREAIMMIEMHDGMHRGDLGSSLPPGSAARRAFDLSLRHSKPLHDITYIMALVEARMEFRRLGYMQSDSSGADESTRQIMEERVSGELHSKGVKMDQWWSALEIEAHVRQRLGILEFSAFQTALCNQEATETQLMMPLAQTLAHRGVCFGDGPRWNAVHVMTLVSEWAHHMTTVVQW